MKYLSVCSGIEAATVAWHPLGWRPWAFAEVDTFPSNVLRHHYPNVPNLGDMTRFKEWPDATIDLLVGGTPCQSFSVAGLRKGLADPRGNLALTFLAIADRYRPRWVVWENVPGVLSATSHDAPDPVPPPPPLEMGRDGLEVETDDEYDAEEVHAFNCLVAGFSELGYFGAYGSLDAQYAGLAQRRLRVFAVFYLGDWRRPAAVLLERESLSWHPAPRRQAGTRTTGTLASRTSAGGGLGTDFDCDGGLVHVSEVSRALTAAHTATGRLDPNEMEFVAEAPYTLAIRGRGDSHDLEYRQDGTANAILTPNGGRGGIGVGAVAFDARQSNVIQYGDKSGPLDTDGHTIAVAFAENQRAELTVNDTAGSLKVGGGKPGQGYPAIQRGMQVRRLTPRECEKLQGFPTCINRLMVRVWFDRDGIKPVRAALCSRSAQSSALLADDAANAVSVQDADLTFWNDQASRRAIAALHVRMSHAAKVVRISSRGRSIWSVNPVAARSEFPLRTPADAIARAVARLVLELVPIAELGRAASQASISGSTHLESGSWPAVTFGPENAVTANDVELRLAEAMKSTTGNRGPSILNSGSSGATLLSCVLAAMTSFIPSETKAASFCDVVLDVESDYTLIPYRGKPAADGPRYKALGNSMAVPVMRWIGRRIQMVDAIGGD